MDRWQTSTADAVPIVECTVSYEVHCHLGQFVIILEAPQKSPACWTDGSRVYCNLVVS